MIGVKVRFLLYRHLDSAGLQLIGYQCGRIPLEGAAGITQQGKGEPPSLCVLIITAGRVKGVSERLDQRFAASRSGSLAIVAASASPGKRGLITPVAT